MYDVQRAFVELIERHRKGGFTSFGSQNVPPKDAFEHPSFIFAKNIPVPTGGALPPPDSFDEPVPFDCFSFVYRTKNGMFLPNTNVVFYDGRGEEPRLYLATKSDDPRLVRRWYHHASHSFADDFDEAPQSTKEFVPEFFYCLKLLHHDREEQQPDVLRAINAGRAKSKNQLLMPVPDFIVIRNDLPSSNSRNADSEGSGTAKSPHDRRGHIRRLASGKLVRVRPSKIHGGGDRPPVYAVV